MLLEARRRPSHARASALALPARRKLDMRLLEARWPPFHKQPRAGAIMVRPCVRPSTPCPLNNNNLPFHHNSSIDRTSIRSQKPTD